MFEGFEAWGKITVVEDRNVVYTPWAYTLLHKCMQSDKGNREHDRYRNPWQNKVMVPLAGKNVGEVCVLENKSHDRSNLERGEELRCFDVAARFRQKNR